MQKPNSQRYSPNMQLNPNFQFASKSQQRTLSPQPEPGSPGRPDEAPSQSDPGSNYVTSPIHPASVGEMPGPDEKPIEPPMPHMTRTTKKKYTYSTPSPQKRPMHDEHKQEGYGEIPGEKKPHGPGNYDRETRPTVPSDSPPVPPSYTPTTTSIPSTTVNPLTEAESPDYLEDDYQHQREKVTTKGIILGTPTLSDTQILEKMIIKYEDNVKCRAYCIKFKAWMKEHNLTGYFTAAITKLTETIARKNYDHVKQILRAFGHAIYYDREQIKLFGEPLASTIIERHFILKDIEPDSFKAYAISFYHAFLRRREEYSVRLNEILDDIDRSYSHDEELRAVGILEAFDKYNGTSDMFHFDVPMDWAVRNSPADGIAHAFIQQVLIQPLRRLALNDLGHEQTMLKDINKMLAKQLGTYEPVKVPVPPEAQYSTPGFGAYSARPKPLPTDLDINTPPMWLDERERPSTTIHPIPDPTMPRPHFPERRTNRGFTRIPMLRTPEQGITNRTLRLLINKTMERLKNNYAFIPKPIQRLPGSLPRGLPESMPRGLPGSMPEALPESMPEGLPKSMPKGLPESLPRALPGALPGATPGGTTVQDPAVPETINDEISSGGQDFLKQKHRLPRTWRAGRSRNMLKHKGRKHSRWFKSSEGHRGPKYRAGHEKKHKAAKHSGTASKEADHQFKKYEKFMKNLDKKYFSKKKSPSHRILKSKKKTIERKRKHKRRHHKRKKNKRETKHHKKYKRHGKKKHRRQKIHRRTKNSEMYDIDLDSEDLQIKEDLNYRNNKPQHKRFEVVGKLVGDDDNQDDNSPFAPPKIPFDSFKNRFNVVKRPNDFNVKKPGVRNPGVDDEDDDEKAMSSSEDDDGDDASFRDQDSEFKETRRFGSLNAEHHKKRHHSRRSKRSSNINENKFDPVASEIRELTVKPSDVLKKLNITGYLKQIKRQFIKRLTSDTMMKKAMPNLRRSGANLTRSTEESDEEHIIKTNIYQAFGYGTPQGL